MNRRVRFTLVFGGVIAVGFGGATAVVGMTNGETLKGSAHPAVHPQAPRLVAEPPSTPSTEVTKPDPRGDGPPWSVLAFKNKDGRPCVAFGRNVNGEVGALDQSGRVQEYPTNEGGSCVYLDMVPAGAQITRGADPEARTIVHGLAGPKVRAIIVTSAAGEEALDIGPHGGFMKVFDPSIPMKTVHVEAELKDGSVIQLI
jgi:hypothetical protein